MHKAQDIKVIAARIRRVLRNTEQLTKSEFREAQVMFWEYVETLVSLILHYSKSDDQWIDETRKIASRLDGMLREKERTAVYWEDLDALLRLILEEDEEV
jgi:hypothetical protein